jgi:H+/Cl- antiporter ClcA
MTSTWRARLDRALRRGEVAGLYFTTALLIIVEFCFVYWLNRIQIPDVPNRGSGFIVLPPWYRKPRFEVTLLLTILAGLLFSVCWGLWDLWQKRTGMGSSEHAAWENAIQSVKQRLRTTTSVAALTGIELALVTWLQP